MVHLDFRRFHARMKWQKKGDMLCHLTKLPVSADTKKKGVEWRHVETRYQHLRSMAHSRWLPIRAAVSSSLCRSVSAPEQTGRPWRPSSQGGMGGPPTYGKFNGWNADKSWNHHWICGSNFDTTPFAYLLEHPDFKHFRRHGNCGWIYGSFHASRSALTRFFSCPSSDLPWPITDGKAGPFVARIDQLLSMSISWVSTLGKIYIFTYYKCIFIYIIYIYMYIYIYVCGGDLYV